MRENPRYKDENKNRFLREAEEKVLLNLTKTDFGPNELAKALGTSRTQLHRKLKSLASLSTSKFINKIKLEQAKRLLETTDLSISEIAFSVGYSTLAYFSKIFS